jgi:hypothetical protein
MPRLPGIPVSSSGHSVKAASGIARDRAGWPPGISAPGPPRGYALASRA